MNTPTICLLTIVWLCLPAKAHSTELVASFDVTVNVQSDFIHQIVIDGRTSLPPYTKIDISISEFVTDEPRGSTEARILSDGTFKSEPLGPEEGLLPGKYLVKVRAHFTKWQPGTVRNSVGDNGELLSGPLVEKDRSHGTIVAVTKTFTIGGEDGERKQRKRFETELEAMEKFHESIDLLHQRVVNKPAIASTDEFLAEIRQHGKLIDELFTNEKARIHAKYLIGTFESICFSARFRRPGLEGVLKFSL